MNRSGYDTCDEDEANDWSRKLNDTIASPEGQAFLRELADALDALPEKVLIADELIDEQGDCCAVGAVCKARGIDATHMWSDADSVAERLGVPLPLVAEIIDENDDGCCDDSYCHDTPESRWQRMRQWVDKRIRKEGGT